MRNFTRDGELKVKTDASSSGNAQSQTGALLAAGVIDTLASDDDGVALSQALSVVADEDGIAEAQSPAEDTPLSLEAPAASLIPPRYITFRSLDDLSAVTFEVVGFDVGGDEASELVDGPVGAAQDDDGIALEQAPTEDTELTLEAAAAELNPPRHLTLTSAGDLSGVNFEIVGLDEDGESQTVAAFAGPNQETLTTNERWSAVTSITPDSTSVTTLTIGWPDTYGTIRSGNGYREITSITPNASDAGTIEVGWEDTDTAFGLVLELTELNPDRRITLTSSDDLSGVDFLLIGQDLNGLPVNEVLTGPDNATVTSTVRFASITDIIPQSIGNGSVSAGWPDELATLYKAEHAVDLTHLFLRNTDALTQEIDLTLVVNGEEIPWRHFDLAQDESASVLHGEPSLPLPELTELRANTTTPSAVSFTLHGAERT